MKVLNIVSNAYRATLEEQDDTVLWLSQTLRRAGAEVDLLLRAGASNYAVSGQGAAPLAIAGRVQSHAPDVHGQLADLVASGAALFLIEEDLEAYGLRECPRLEPSEVVANAALPGLLARYDAVWHW